MVEKPSSALPNIYRSTKSSSGPGATPGICHADGYLTISLVSSCLNILPFVMFFGVTQLKFHSEFTPEKLLQNTKRKKIVFQPSFFRGDLLNFGSVGLGYTPPPGKWKIGRSKNRCGPWLRKIRISPKIIYIYHISYIYILYHWSYISNGWKNGPNRWLIESWIYKSTYTVPWSYTAFGR